MYLTVLTSTRGLQVKVYKSDGSQEKIGGFLYHVSTPEFHDLHGLHGIISNLTHHQMFVPGERNEQQSLKADGSVQCTWREKVAQDGSIRQHAFFRDRAAPTLTFDIDDMPLPTGCGWHDPQTLAATVWAHLQAAYSRLQGVGCVWNASGSAGISEGVKMHFHVILNQPLREHDRAAILNAMSQDVDVSMSQIVRKHYEAGRICEGFVDPLANVQRSGVIDGGPMMWEPTTVLPKPPARVQVQEATETLPSARSMLDTMCQDIKDTTKGTRHATVRAKAYTAGGLVGAGELVLEEARTKLYDAVSGYNDPEHHHETIEEMLLDGMEEPFSSRGDLAEQFGTTGPSQYTPAGMLTEKPPTPVEVLQDRVLTMTKDDERVADTVKTLSMMPKTDRAEVLDVAAERNPAVAEVLQKDIKSEHIGLRTNMSQKMYEDEHLQILNRYVVVENGGGTDGASIVYEPRTGERASFRAFHERHSNMGKIIVGEKVDAKGEPKPVEELVTKFWIENTAPRYHRIEYNPTQGQEFWNESDGKYCMNSYRPGFNTAPKPGDVSPYLYLLAANYPNEQDQKVLLGAMAFSIQKQGLLLKWAPVLQGTQGCGKGVLIQPVLDAAGMHNSSLPTPSNLSEDKNGWMGQGTVVFVDEIGEHRKATIKEIADRLKVPIASSIIGVRAMGKDLTNAKNFACWFMATNFKNSMLQNDTRERRYAPLISALQSPQDVFDAFPVSLWDAFPDVVQGAKAHPNYSPTDWFGLYMFWYECCGGEAAVRDYLLNNCTPATPGRAPETTTKGEAIMASRDAMTTAIAEAIEGGDIGFRGGFASSVAVRQLLEEDGLSKASTQWISQAFETLGYVRCIRRPQAINTNDAIWFGDIASDKSRVTIYAKDQSLFDRPAKHIAEFYKQAQELTPDE